MAIFWKSFLLFLFVQGSHSLIDSVVEGCANIFATNKAENPMQYCSGCLNVIYRSGIINDPLFNKNIDVRRLNESFNFLCSHFNTTSKQLSTCYKRFIDCANSKFRQLKNCYDVIPCLKEGLTFCTHDFIDIVSKALMMSRTYGCVLSSQHFKLTPFYGPELHCYPKVQDSSGLSATKLGQNYQYFCSKFTNGEVSECIIETKLTPGSSPVVDAAYIENTKKFFRGRSMLCKYFSETNDNKTCASIDVSSCQNSLWKKELMLKPFDDLLKIYAQCAYDKYKPCSPSLAQVIKFNLDGIQSNDAMSSGYSLIIFSITIFSVYFEIIRCM